MNLYLLIFSNNRNYRLSRHAIFWFAWIAYYTTFSAISYRTSYPLSNRVFSALIETSLSTPMDMAYCYSIIYFLLPQFLFKGRYIGMVLLWLLFSVVFIVLFEVYVLTIVPHIRDWYAMPKPMKPESYYWIFFSLFSQINMEGCLAAAIKLGKLSFVKQQEVDLLKAENAKLPAALTDVELQPVFLVDIINRMEQLAAQNPAAVQDVIKNLRSLLVYMIYENKKTKVQLAKELQLIQEYIQLEKSIAQQNVAVSYKVTGDAGDESIASFILLPVIENAFKQLALLQVAEKQININITISNAVLTLQLSWSKPMDTSTLAEGRNVVLQNISKRLNLIYPQSHEIRFFIEVSEIVVLLKIDLKQAIN